MNDALFNQTDDINNATESNNDEQDAKGKEPRKIDSLAKDSGR